MQQRIFEKIRQPNGSFLLAISTRLSNDRVNVSPWDHTESCEISYGCSYASSYFIYGRLGGAIEA